MKVSEMVGQLLDRLGIKTRANVTDGPDQAKLAAAVAAAEKVLPMLMSEGWETYKSAVEIEIKLQRQAACAALLVDDPTGKAHAGQALGLERALEVAVEIGRRGVAAEKQLDELEGETKAKPKGIRIS